MHPYHIVLDELGPEGFCMIAFEEGENSDIIGSISAKPFEEPTTAIEKEGKHPRMHYKRSVATPSAVVNGVAAGEGVQDESGEKWELLMMGVALKVKGMGVASRLMEKCVEEIGRRVGEEVAGVGGGEGGDGKSRVVLYLSTMKELTEVYYQRKGWKTTSTTRVEAGVARNRDPFHVVEMVKVV